MKKFYAFAAAAMLAVSANAADALYAVGSGEGLGWTPKTPAEFAIVDGNFVLEVADLTEFKISTVCDPETEGDGWTEFNSGVLGCTYGDVPGVAVALEEGYDANIKAPWKGNYTITVTPDFSTITLTTDTPKPDENALPVVYVRGDMNGWGVDEAWQMESISKTMFKFTTTTPIVAGEAFKFADADWSPINVGCNSEEGDVLLNTEWEVFNGGNPANLVLAANFEGTIYLNLNVEIDEETTMALVYFSADGSEPEWFSGVKTVAAAAGEAQYFTLQGVRVANPENGLYIIVKDGKATKAILK